MLEYWTFSKEDFPSVQIQVERADTWLGRFCGLMMRKGAVTKWLIILLQPLFCVFISSFLALL